MKKIKLDTSWEKENQYMKNTSITEDDNNEVKTDYDNLKVYEIEDYDELFGSEISFQAGNLRQSEVSTGNDETLLHVAAKYGYVKNMEILINHRVNLEARDKAGCTALHLASINGHYLCVKQLLEAGTECSAPVINISSSGMAYTEGSTALHLASRYNHVNCVKLLIQFGANCEAVDINGCTSLYIATQAGYSECVLTHLRHAHGSAFLSLPSYDTSYTPLHFAVENGMVECVKQLVHLGSNVNHINKSGFSPLNFACHTSILPEDIRIQILKIFVLEGHNTDMNYLLYQIMLYGCCPAVKAFLVAYGANVNIKNEMSGVTLLEHELIWQTNFDFLKCIVNSMLQLPHLNTLNINPLILLSPQENMISEELVFPEGVAYRIVRGEGNVYLEISNTFIPFIHAPPDINPNLVNSHFILPYVKLVPLHQPFLNLVYEHINNELKECSLINIEKVKVKDNLPEAKMFFKNHLLYLKKQLWYEIMASTPRTLKHCCRFSIRKCMGPSSLKNITKLPLPKQLLSYLLFEYDE